MACALSATAILVTLLSVGSCGRAGEPDRRTVGSPAAVVVRTDREPVARRFPALGEFTEVHWTGHALGQTSGRVPGPTDVRVQALVRLRPEDARSLDRRHQWYPAPSPPVIPAELQPYVVDGGTWLRSPAYEAEVRGSWAGTVWLEAVSDTVWLDLTTT
jgi:hypothetical protein